MDELAPAARVQNFLGVEVDAVTFPQMLASVDEWLRDGTGRSRHIACINTYCVTSALRDRHLAAIYNGADIRGADSMPFTYWLRWVRRQPCDRLYGPDIVMRLAAHASTVGYSFYLYGGSPDVLAGMQRHLKDRFPGLSIVGSHSPPFRPLTDEERVAVLQEITALKPDIVLVGLGTPKQDYWIDRHLAEITGTVFVACGAAFDFFGGRVKMAPRVIQRSGFEWLYRLLGPDFRRLWRRYTVDNAVFLFNFALQLLRLRVRKPVPPVRRGSPEE